MKLILILILLTPLFLFGQDITLTEGSDVEVCGRTLRIDGIWIDNGRIKADISVLREKNSKPITGGYKSRDTIYIDKCRYVVMSISKYGLNSSAKGKVSLLTEIDQEIQAPTAESFFMSSGGEYNLGKQKWTVKSVTADSAIIDNAEGELRVKQIVLKINDIVWRGAGAYIVSGFPKALTSDKRSVELKIIRDYSYLNPNTPSIDEALINPPPMGMTQLIIRKMKYYPKQKFNQEEYNATPVKYWVLKIFFYPTGMVHQMIELTILGYKSMYEFEGYKSFDTEAEALEFAKVNGITDIVLTE
ncbi:MAG: hypothetical protein JST55_13250 [Bacteroidetes bacterium]|nr:hypothetical protein [Bacteroidota bacterium]